MPQVSDSCDIPSRPFMPRRLSWPSAGMMQTFATFTSPDESLGLVYELDNVAARAAPAAIISNSAVTKNERVIFNLLLFRVFWVLGLRILFTVLPGRMACLTGLFPGGSPAVRFSGDQLR